MVPSLAYWVRVLCLVVVEEEAAVAAVAEAVATVGPGPGPSPPSPPGTRETYRRRYANVSKRYWEGTQVIEEALEIGLVEEEIVLTQHRSRQ